jgi:hypothetical protein
LRSGDDDLHVRFVAVGLDDGPISPGPMECFFDEAFPDVRVVEDDGIRSGGDKELIIHSEFAVVVFLGDRQVEIKRLQGNGLGHGESPDDEVHSDDIAGFEEIADRQFGLLLEIAGRQDPGASRPVRLFLGLPFRQLAPVVPQEIVVSVAFDLTGPEER